MSVTDAHSSIYFSSMTIYLTINDNTIKDVNKTTLRHLLSLPHISVTKRVGRMSMAVGSTCTLHASLHRDRDGEGRKWKWERMLAVIKSSMKFLDIK